MHFSAAVFLKKGTFEEKQTYLWRRLNIINGSEPKLNLCVFLILITTILSHTTNAYKIEESISINKPIMRRGSLDPTGWVQFSTEYVRCFCNLPSCVGTAYMCKSSGGGCFSELLDQGSNHGAFPRDDYKGLHGCVELLNDRNQRKWCENNDGSSSKTNYRKRNQSKSLLLCCYHDMCNHADSPETKVLLNDTVLSASTNESDNRSVDSIGIKQDTVLYTESEVWFRAATIAVPICGVVILLVLIILAVKLLRTESTNHTISNPKLGMSSYSYTLSSDIKNKNEGTFPHHNVIGADFFSKDSHHNPVYLNEFEDVRVQGYIPLLIQDEIRNIEKNCDKKNETNAKLNLMQELDQRSVVGDCDSTRIVSQHLFHKNTDLHFGRNMILSGTSENSQDISSDKTYCKESIS